MTEHEKLVERVARAIWEAEPKRIGSSRRVDWRDESEETHNKYRPLATAALAAVYAELREPTEAMIDEAQRAWTPGVSYGEAHAIRYRAMHSASALNPEN